MTIRTIFSIAASVAFTLALALTLNSCAHPNAALGDFRGRYVKAGFMMNDSSIRSEIVLTARGELFALEPGSSSFIKKETLPKLKTKAAFHAVEKTGILEKHNNTKGVAMTLFLEYHKRNKVYRYSWGELSWPDGVKEAYNDLVKLHTSPKTK